jgi:hypothetical protein
MPEVQQVHIDAALTNVSVAFRNEDYIADLVAPPVPVRKQSDRYYIYDNERERLRQTNDSRAPGAEANEVNFSLSSDSYYCEDHALVSAVPDEERENADPILQPDIDRTEFLTDRILLNREIALAEKLRTSTDISETEVDASERWENVDFDPLPALQSARLAVFGACQRRANTIVIPYNAFEVLRNHPKVVERIKYTTTGVLNEELMAQLLGVERVLVPRSFKNTARKGQAASVVPVWGTNCYVMHVPPRPAARQVALAYSFVWNGASGSVNGTLVEKWREPGRKADMVRVQKYYDHKIIAGGAGYRLVGVIS